MGVDSVRDVARRGRDVGRVAYSGAELVEMLRIAATLEEHRVMREARTM